MPSFVRSTLVLLLIFETSSCFEFLGRLSTEEATELSRTCGRKPSSIGLTATQKKSAYSQLTNRTFAPWAVEVGGCSAVLISKRHILTAEHCVDEYIMASHYHGVAKFPMTCANGVNCLTNKHQDEDQKEIKQEMKSNIELEIGDIYYNMDTLYQGRVKGDIALMLLRKDAPLSNIIYPACLAGYQAGKNDTYEQFGFGCEHIERNFIDAWNSTKDEVAVGIDHAGYLQTFTARQVSGGSERDVMGFRGTAPTPNALTQGGDSGSGFIHTRNGIHSVYTILSAGSDVDDFANRVSAHLFWLNLITGIEVKNEDEEFVAYFYPLLYKDKRNKETFLAGASHPTKIAEYI